MEQARKKRAFLKKYIVHNADCPGNLKSKLRPCKEES